MIRTKSKVEKFAGSSPSTSPTNQKRGVFSFCSGGVPTQGSFARLPGKVVKNTSETRGGAITMYAFGRQVVVQYVFGVEIVDGEELVPNFNNYVFDNDGNQVFDEDGISVTIA